MSFFVTACLKFVPSILASMKAVAAEREAREEWEEWEKWKEMEAREEREWEERTEREEREWEERKVRMNNLKALTADSEAQMDKLKAEIANFNDVLYFCLVVIVSIWVLVVCDIYFFDGVLSIHLDRASSFAALVLSGNTIVEHM